MFIRSASSLLPLAGFMLASVRQSVAQTCLSYGIDFVSNGNYFINTNSNDNFTTVSQFSGCQNDTANIILAGPGIEVYCSDIPLQPDFTSEMSTCPLEKSQMVTGEYEMTIISNNGDAEPIAYQRDFSITAGPQQTVTATATVIFNQTTTPIITSTTTQTVSSVITVNNTLTTTIPSATQVTTLTPKPTTTTLKTTLTRTLKTWTRTAFFTTVTVTATCTVPPRPQNPDPTWHTRPQILVSLPTGLSNPNHKRDEMFAIRDALRKDRRSGKLSDLIRGDEIDKRDLVKRSADAPTVTVTQTSVTATSTSTFTGATSTVSAIDVTTVTSTTYLPPVTVYSGVAKQTVTASQQTKTRYSVTTTYSWQVKTMTASFTATSTVLPSASVTACKKQGGHFGGGAWWLQ